jgi:hypothetical protein
VSSSLSDVDILADLVEESIPLLAAGEARSINALMRKRATYRQWGREPEAQTMGKAIVISLHAMLRPEDPDPVSVI